MMLLSEAAKALGGKMIGEDARFTAVSSDTRKLQPGDLFIALRGENFDGCEFVAQAAQDGAVAALVEERGAHTEHAGIPLLVVKDTRLALGQLAAHWRRRFNVSLVAITGSNGKTTVKEMLACILRAAAGSDDAVLATRGNFNNDIGMPLTLLQLNAQHRYAVIEMGMNHPGEIDYLSRIACPDVALITNASGAHLEGLGSVEAVARAKGEIFAGLNGMTGRTEASGAGSVPEAHGGGTAIINADDAYAPLWRSLVGTRPLLEFGLDQQADVSGQWVAQGAGQHLSVQTPVGRFTADLQVPGEHNARNALAATAAAVALNVPLETIVAGLEKFGGVAGRLQRRVLQGGAILIDDTYNANPASMRAAIAVLAQAPGKRVMVMGDMGELGDDAAVLHAGIGREAKHAGIEKLYALGELSRNAVREFGEGAQHFGHIDALLSALEKELDANTTVLVKGSRFMKMERVVSHCAGTVKGEEKREKGGTDTGSPSPLTLPPAQTKEAH